MAWYNENWTYRKKITIDPTKIPSDVSDFPVYLNLADLGSDFFDHVNADGGDIRITTDDGETEVPVEVVAIDTGTDTGEVHFKAPSLSSSVDTVFYIYYGNAGASLPAANATYGKYNVWRSEYKLVTHDGGVNDSTSNQNNGSANGGVTGGGATGKMGKATTFDGTDDFFSIPDSASLDVTGEITISAWYKHSSAQSGSNPFILSKAEGPYEAHIRGADQGIRYITSGDVFLDTEASLNTEDVYHKIDWNYDDVNNTTISYFDGVSKTLTNNGAGTLGDPIETNATALRIGARYNNSLYFNGDIDEVRIYAGELDSAWITTEYNNQNSPSTFYSIGSESLNTTTSTSTSTSTTSTSTSTTTSTSTSTTSTSTSSSTTITSTSTTSTSTSTSTTTSSSTSTSTTSTSTTTTLPYHFSVESGQKPALSFSVDQDDTPYKVDHGDIERA